MNSLSTSFCKEKPYVIAKMMERGVIFNEQMTESLGKTIAPAYAENLMVFVKASNNRFQCPFTPPGRGSENGIADWGGWE